MLATIDVLSEKQKYLEKIFQLSLKLYDAVDHEDEDSIHKLLDERQSIMADIDILDVEVNKAGGYRQIPDPYELKPKIKQLINQIQKLDAVSFKKMNLMHEGTNQAIQRVNIGKKAMTNGYFKEQTQLYGYFIDQKIGR